MTRQQQPGAFSDEEEKRRFDRMLNDAFAPLSGKVTPVPKFISRKSDEAALDQQRTKISLRIPNTDLERLKAKASAEGMPYQTLINSILHKAVS